MLASWMSNSLPLEAWWLTTQQVVQVVGIPRCWHDVSSLTVHGALKAMRLSGLQIMRAVLLQNSRLPVALAFMGNLKQASLLIFQAEEIF